MPRTDLLNRPQTAPRHRPSFAMRHRVLDTVFPVGSVRTISIADVEPRDFRSTAHPVVVDAPPHIYVVDSASIDVDTFVAEPTTFCFISQTTAIRVANIWNQLQEGILRYEIVPATAQQPTQSSAQWGAVDEDSRLDEAFAALMNYTPEPEQADERERRPSLRYRHPRR